MESPPLAKSCFVPDPLNLMIPSGLKEFDELILPNHLSDPKSGNSKQSRTEMNLQYANGSAHLKQVKMESVKSVKNKELVSSSGSAYDGIQRNFEMQEDKQLHGSGPRPFRVTNSQVENEIEDKLSAFASNSSSSKPLIKYRFDTTQIHSDLQCLSPNNQDTTSKQPDPQFTLDSILKYFTTKNLYFECLHYELIGYYLAFVFSLMSLYLAVSSGEKWCHIVVPFLVIDIIMLLRFGNITKKPQITSKVFSLGLSILVHSCLIIYEFWSFASIWFVALLPLGNTIYRIGWNKVQYGPKLMFPYLLIRDVQIFFCTLRLVFGWPSWTGALVFAFGTAVFDICVLALFVFKVAFLIINSIAKKDLKILQNNRNFAVLPLVFGFEVITIMYKLQSIFLFVLGLKVASYLDLPNSKAKQEASAAAVAVLILTSVFGALIVHYSKYCKMAYADQPNSMMESPITVKQSTTFRSYLAYLVSAFGNSGTTLQKLLQDLENCRSSESIRRDSVKVH